MKCNHIQKYFSEYIDDRLAENLKSAVESHLGTCPACREELAALKKVVAHVRDLPETRAPENFLSRVDQRFEPASGFKAILQYLKTHFRFNIPFGFATATAVAVVLIFMIHMEQPQKSMTRFKTEKPAIETLEGVAAPEKEIKSPTDVADTAKEPLWEPKISSLEQKKEQQKQTRQEVFYEKADTAAEFEMAAAPDPAAKGTPVTIKWELRLNSTPDRDLDEKPLYKAKAAKPRPLAAMSADDLSVSEEEHRTRAGSEGLAEDEDDERSSTTMDQAVDDVAALTKNLGGTVVSSEKSRSPSYEHVIILTLPANRMKELYTELGRMGRFSLQPEELPEPAEDSVTIHLKLTSL